jgi:hypothetical protein
MPSAQVAPNPNVPWGLRPTTKPEARLGSVDFTAAACALALSEAFNPK